MDQKSKKRKRYWRYPIKFAFILKAGCMACLTIVALACFAESHENPLSEAEKENIRGALYSLLELSEARERERLEKLKQQKEIRERTKIFLDAIMSVDEEGKEPEEIEDSDETEEGKITEKEHISKWSHALAIKNSSYVITLFQRDKRLMKWLKRSPELIHFAVQFGNLDLLRFFSEEGELINAAREHTHFSPLHTAIISRRLSVIRFFFGSSENRFRSKKRMG